MFETVQAAAPDPILGLTEAFNQDPNPGKINLSVGVFKDAQGKTPILAAVKEAERRLLAAEQTKGYKPIDGDPAYGKAVRQLLFGETHALVGDGRARTAHTPGGTGGLRVAADYLKKVHPSAKIWISDPTWANHPQLFEAAGLGIATYPYFDKATNGLAFERMLTALGSVPNGDVVLLHACCHNPTGVDPTPAQWQELARVVRDRKLLPLVDFAYQGFGDGVDEDAAGLRTLVDAVDEALVCSSFSKNFGLYNERVGALTVLARTPQAAESVLSQIKICVRTNYSNPPAHGAAIVSTILSDAELRRQWLEELTAMRRRINGMRELLVRELAAKGVAGDYGFITRQRGMFSFSGLTREQVEALRERFSIYIVGSGRINVAGLSEANVGALCDAIRAVQ